MPSAVAWRASFRLYECNNFRWNRVSAVQAWRHDVRLCSWSIASLPVRAMSVSLWRHVTTAYMYDPPVVDFSSYCGAGWVCLDDDGPSLWLVGQSWTWQYAWPRGWQRQFQRFTFDRHCCHLGTAIKHPVPDQVKPSFVIFDIKVLWRSGLNVRVPGCQKLQMTA